ncbi:MAG: hypothetical protein ABR524_11910 [Thermoanaerobaculia bacterium]
MSNGGFVVDATRDVLVSADIPGTASVEEVLEAFSSAGTAIGPGAGPCRHPRERRKRECRNASER